MSNNGPEQIEQYSPIVGLIYVFNLIVGTGCLTLPAAFASAGWLLSICGICLLALMSFCTTTWVLESMACANALRQWRRAKQLKKREQVDDIGQALEMSESERLFPSDTSEEQEESPLIAERTVEDFYVIQERIEMGQMAKLFFKKGWVNAFYVVLCIYLYGDLSIYEAVVAKSLRDITCSYIGENCHTELKESDPCFPNYSFTRLDMYRLFVGIFVASMGPFVFCNLSKTKYMQILTTFTRWLALGSMIIWAVVLLAEREWKGSPSMANIRQLPVLFGVAIYSFMCHHSLPSLVTPINEKKSLFKLLAADYFLILLFYNLLALTGVFTFSHVNDLYTLNFQPDPCRDRSIITPLLCLQMFLLLFPVFTLSTTFPIIAITLRNNLKGLFLKETRQYSFFVFHCLFPLLAVSPPTIISLITSDVELLVGITGAYAGSLIQYVVPAFLVYFARKTTVKRIGLGMRNPFESPLQHSIFIVIVCVWAVICQVFVSVYIFGRES